MLDGYVIFVLGVATPIIVAEVHIQPHVVGLIGTSLVLVLSLEQELAARCRTILAGRS